LERHLTEGVRGCKRYVGEGNVEVRGRGGGVSTTREGGGAESSPFRRNAAPRGRVNLEEDFFFSPRGSHAESQKGDGESGFYREGKAREAPHGHFSEMLSSGHCLQTSKIKG